MIHLVPRLYRTSNMSDLFQECVQAVEAGQATVENCVTRFPNQSELAQLLHVMRTVQDLPRPVFPAASKAAIWQRVAATYRTNRAAAKPRHYTPVRRVPRWVQFALVTGILVLLLFTGSAGLIQAAQAAVPGDELYGLKRLTERVELWAADSQARPDMLYHLALNRVSELDTLSGRGDPLSDPELADLSESIQAALAVQADQTKQSHLLESADTMLQEAEVAGTLGAGKRAKVMQTLLPTPAGVTPPDPSPTALVVQPVVPTETPTATASPTWTPTPTETPVGTAAVEGTSDATGTDVQTPTDGTSVSADSNPGSVPTKSRKPLKTSPTPKVGNNNSNANGANKGGRGDGK